MLARFSSARCCCGGVVEPVPVTNFVGSSWVYNDGDDPVGSLLGQGYGPFMVGRIDPTIIYFYQWWPAAAATSRFFESICRHASFADNAAPGDALPFSSPVSQALIRIPQWQQANTPGNLADAWPTLPINVKLSAALDPIAPVGDPADIKTWPSTTAVRDIAFPSLSVSTKNTSIDVDVTAEYNAVLALGDVPDPVIPNRRYWSFSVRFLLYGVGATNSIQPFLTYPGIPAATEWSVGWLSPSEDDVIFYGGPGVPPIAHGLQLLVAP